VQGRTLRESDYYEVQVVTAGATWDTRFDDYNKHNSGGPDPATKRYGHQSWTSRRQQGIVFDTAGILHWGN